MLQGWRHYYQAGGYSRGLYWDVVCCNTFCLYPNKLFLLETTFGILQHEVPDEGTLELRLCVRWGLPGCSESTVTGSAAADRQSRQEKHRINYCMLAVSLRRYCRGRFLQSDAAEGLGEPGGLLMGTATRVTAVCSYIPAAEVCAAPDMADILPGNGKSQTKSQTSSTFRCMGFLCSSATVIPTVYSFQITILACHFNICWNKLASFRGVNTQFISLNLERFFF